MENKENEKLWWYGWRANFKKGFGKFLIFVGTCLGIGLFFINIYLGIIVGVVMVAYGVYLFFKGKTQRFDYEKQAGIIIERGDKVQ